MRVRAQRQRQPQAEELLHQAGRMPAHSQSPVRLQAKLTVSTPGDLLEQEADQVADQVMRMAEPRFGHDFSRLRVHSDAPAAQTFGSVVQRQPAPNPQPAQAATLPTAEELTTRLARCIGIWETNRGGNDPAPVASTLDTVAGVKASYATLEQATMPYAITVLKGNKAMRDKASPPLTIKELNAAEARCVAVKKLLKSVETASGAGTTPDDFIKNNTTAISDSGLSDADVKTMFQAETLEGTLAKARTDMAAAAEAAKEQAAKEKKSEKEQKKAGKDASDKARTEAIDAIPTADRLGLGKGSLKAYIDSPKKWGENAAAWQRKAVEAMPDDVGGRIKAVAEADNGMSFAVPTIRARVDAELAKTPVPSEQDIVMTVAQQNNPGEAKYGLHVWETYDRLY